MGYLGDGLWASFDFVGFDARMAWHFWLEEKENLLKLARKEQRADDEASTGPESEPASDAEDDEWEGYRQRKLRRDTFPVRLRRWLREVRSQVVPDFLWDAMTTPRWSFHGTPRPILWERYREAWGRK